MKTSTISSLTMQNSMRNTIADAQSQMVDAQKEVTTGKYADVGTAIGAKSSSAIDLNSDSQRLQNLMDTNAIVTQRLDSSQTALQQMSTAAQSLENILVSVGSNTDATTLATAQQTAESALQTFISAANTSSNGEYLFSGVNTDVEPMADYYAVDSSGNESAARQAFKTAFQSAFGTVPPADDPDTAGDMSGITSDQMTSFLDDLETSFTGSDYTDTWSSASDDTMTSRITKNEVVQSSSTANADGFRYMALASAISAEMLTGNFSTDARNTMVQRAIKYVGLAIDGLNTEQTQLGLSQERVTKADTSLQAQKDILDTQLNDLVGVDAYSASTKLNNLQSLVETSYTLTSRLQKLSLVDYLS